MGGRKRRRKILRRLPKRVPKVFNCPNCDSKSVTIEMNKRLGIAYVRCGCCGIEVEIENLPEVFEEVHVFNKFVDLYYEGKGITH